MQSSKKEGHNIGFLSRSRIVREPVMGWATDARDCDGYGVCGVCVRDVRDVRDVHDDSN